MLVCIMCIILVELNFTSILLSFLDKQSLGLWQHLRVCSCFACKARVERADVIDYVRLVETAAAVAAANVNYSIEASRAESTFLCCFLASSHQQTSFCASDSTALVFF